MNDALLRDALRRDLFRQWQRHLAEQLARYPSVKHGRSRLTPLAVLTCATMLELLTAPTVTGEPDEVPGTVTRRATMRVPPSADSRGVSLAGGGGKPSASRAAKRRGAKLRSTRRSRL